MKLSARHSRLLAVGLLVLAILVVAALLMGPVLAVRAAQADAIEGAARELKSYRAMAASAGTQQQRLAELRQRNPAAGLYVRGATPALASASMQQTVNGLVGRHGAELVSTQMLPGDRGEAAGLLSLRVHLRAELGAAMGILHALESGNPMLFVDDLVISARPVRGESVGDPPQVQLDMQFTLEGYAENRG